MDNRRITFRDVAYDVGILSGSCQAIFKNVLDMKRVAAKIVPKFLNFRQKQRYHLGDSDPKLRKKVITGGELWMYGYDIEIKAQGSIQKSQDRRKHIKFGQI